MFVFGGGGSIWISGSSEMIRAILVLHAIGISNTQYNQLCNYCCQTLKGASPPGPFLVSLPYVQVLQRNYNSLV